MSGAQTLSPCAGCRKRELGCHITCKAYLLYKASREEFLERRAEQSRIDALIRTKGKKRKK